MFDPKNKDLLESYAESLCASRGEATAEDSGSKYRQRVSESIEMFHIGHNKSGLAAILEKLPHTGDDTYADLCISCWQSILQVDPHYYKDLYSKTNNSAVLNSLMNYPTKFGLCRPGAPPCLQEVSSQMFKHVLSINPNQYNNLNLAWLEKIRSARLVNFFVDRAARNLPMHELDLSIFPELEASDLRTFSLNLRETKSIDLSGLMNLDSSVLGDVTKNFEFLERLVLRDCKNLMDIALETTAETCRWLREIVLNGCVHLTSKGVAAIASNCKKLEHVELSKCHRISNESLERLGEGCDHLMDLKVNDCIHIRDQGLCSLALNARLPEYLLKLSLANCIYITDKGLREIANTFISIEDLDLSNCVLLTNKSVRRVTHNMWKLKRLLLTGLHLISDDIFVFDTKDDGRPAAELNMLSKIECLEIQDCPCLTDIALRELGKRTSSIMRINIGGCSFTESGIMNLFKHPITGKPRNLSIREFECAYCSNVSDKFISTLCGMVPTLEVLNISGCLKLSDSSLCHAANDLNQLQTLKIAHCRYMTTKGFSLVAKKFWLLELDVGHCSQISEDALLKCVERCNGLESLNVTWCSSVSDKFVSFLIGTSTSSSSRRRSSSGSKEDLPCPNLKTLNLSHCTRVSEEKVMELRKVMPKLNVMRGRSKKKYRRTMGDFKKKKSPGIMAMTKRKALLLKEKSDVDSGSIHDEKSLEISGPAVEDTKLL